MVDLRATRAPAVRATAHPDESPPSLHVLQLYNKHSATRPMCIRVAKVPTKGLGVLARSRIRQGTAVALYRFRLVARATCPSGDYRVEVKGHPNRIGKIDEGTFGPPEDGLALVGPLLNEPSAGGQANCARGPCQVDAAGTNNRRGSFSLVTIVDVPAGEELTWNYGSTYGRRPYAPRLKRSN